jgi:hypothetical protein
MRCCFFNIFVGLLKKILNTKILLASMKTRILKIVPKAASQFVLLRLTISVIGQFSPRDPPLLDRRKVGRFKHFMVGLRNNFQNHRRVLEQVLQSQAGF